jgi:flagellar biosynthesis protein FlhF
MKIKKYTAKSMKEALLQIKEELGEDAIILKTSKTSHGMFPFTGREEIEVTAAIDDQAATRRAMPALPPLRVPDSGVYKRPVNHRRVHENEAYGSLLQDKDGGIPLQKPISAGSGRAPQASGLNVIDIKEDIRELKELLNPVFMESGMPASGELKGPWGNIRNRLIASDVNESIACGLINRIKGAGEVSAHEADKRFMEVLQASFPVSGPIKLKEKGPVVCVFAGPTGVGKTTTLAKLAAHYRLNKNKAVSIITADTYRIAAIEQIRVFAEIMDIRLQTVFSPDEIANALEASASDDIVLVDTAGRSRKNTEHMNDLAVFMDALHPDETHLVLSATTKDKDLMENIDRYRPMGVNRVVFTKFDETSRLGNVFNCVVKSAIPASYFTFGQGVPDDIELAQPGRFMNHLWKESA